MDVGIKYEANRLQIYVQPIGFAKFFEGNFFRGVFCQGRCCGWAYLILPRTPGAAAGRRLERSGTPGEAEIQFGNVVEVSQTSIITID